MGTLGYTYGTRLAEGSDLRGTRAPYKSSQSGGGKKAGISKISNLEDKKKYKIFGKKKKKNPTFLNFHAAGKGVLLDTTLQKKAEHHLP